MKMNTGGSLFFCDAWYKLMQLMDWCNAGHIDIAKSREAIKEAHKQLDAMDKMLDILEGRQNVQCSI